MGKVKEMASKEQLKELKDMRESAGIPLKELCEFIGIGTGVYSLYENGERGLELELYDYLYYKVSNAINKISQTENYLFKHVTDSQLNEAIKMNARGFNIVKIATSLGVCEVALTKELRKREIEVLDFSKY